MADTAVTDTARIGVDGCAGGWICAIRVPDGTQTIEVFPSFAALLSVWPRARIAVDVPVGLPELGPRACDVLARSRLGRRRASVFPAPLRPCLAASSQAEASAIRRAAEAKGVNVQTWGIFPKIRDVDGEMTAQLQHRVVETHPELVFAAMNGWTPLQFSKKAPAGRAERLSLLARHLQGTDDLVRSPRPPRSAPDDVLDAMAALWTADRLAAGVARRLPETPARDRHGLQMAIWY